jgi:hypothetical protein
MLFSTDPSHARNLGRLTSLLTVLWRVGLMGPFSDLVLTARQFPVR